MKGSPMRTIRFYHTNLTDSKILLDKSESAHARKVLRLKPDDQVSVFDGMGGLAEGRVASTGQVVELQIMSREQLPVPTPRIDIAAPLPKGDRAAVLIEKASELGAHRFIPLITQRSVVDPRSAKLDRLRRIAVESAKQCGRAWLMEIAEPTRFEEVIAESDRSLRLITDNSHSDEAFSLGTHRDVIVLIGPEGGWTDTERGAARDAGFTRWCFHHNSLRLETAALAALAILQARAYSESEHSR